jgi:hypothetical protein
MAKTLKALKNEVDELGGYNFMTYELVQKYYTKHFNDNIGLRYPRASITWNLSRDYDYKHDIELLFKAIERDESLTEEESGIFDDHLY